MPGMFIDVEVAEEVRGDAGLAKKLEDACPVDIYAARDGGVEVVEENLDECVLCELCSVTHAASSASMRPPGSV